MNGGNFAGCVVRVVDVDVHVSHVAAEDFRRAAVFSSDVAHDTARAVACLVVVFVFGRCSCDFAFGIAILYGNAVRRTDDAADGVFGSECYVCVAVFHGAFRAVAARLSEDTAQIVAC